MAAVKSPILKRIVRDLIVGLFYTVRAVARALPLKVSLKLGAFLGRLCFHTLPYERKIALRNIASSFPEKNDAEVRRIAKESFIHLGICLCEILNMPKIMRRFDEFVTIDGLEHLRDATKEKGCIYITGHVGNWELMAAYLAHIGFHITPIAKELYDKRLNDVLINLRAQSGVQTILRNKPDTSKKIIRALKGDGVLGMLIDQDTKVQGIFVDFFGKKAYTTVGAASLAMKFDCKVIAGFSHRENGKHKIVVTPIETVKSGDKDADLHANTLAYSKAVENAIRAYPPQWVWMHNRWKTKPKT